MWGLAASTAADRSTAEGNAASASGVAASAQRIAAGLKHLAASSIAAAASDTATVFRQLALGMSAAKVALEYHLAVPQAAAIANTTLEHLA